MDILTKKEERKFTKADYNSFKANQLDKIIKSLNGYDFESSNSELFEIEKLQQVVKNINKFSEYRETKKEAKTGREDLTKALKDYLDLRNKSFDKAINMVYQNTSNESQYIAIPGVLEKSLLQIIHANDSIKELELIEPSLPGHRSSKNIKKNFEEHYIDIIAASLSLVITGAIPKSQSPKLDADKEIVFIKQLTTTIKKIGLDSIEINRLLKKEIPKNINNLLKQIDDSQNVNFNDINQYLKASTELSEQLKFENNESISHLNNALQETIEAIKGNLKSTLNKQLVHNISKENLEILLNLTNLSYSLGYQTADQKFIPKLIESLSNKFTKFSADNGETNRFAHIVKNLISQEDSTKYGSKVAINDILISATNKIKALGINDKNLKNILENIDKVINVFGYQTLLAYSKGDNKQHNELYNSVKSKLEQILLNEDNKVDSKAIISLVQIVKGVNPTKTGKDINYKETQIPITITENICKILDIVPKIYNESHLKIVQTILSAKFTAKDYQYIVKNFDTNYVEKLQTKPESCIKLLFGYLSSTGDNSNLEKFKDILSKLSISKDATAYELLRDTEVQTSDGKFNLVCAAAGQEEGYLAALLNELPETKVKEILNHKSSTKGTTPLMYAAHKGNIHNTELLLEKGSDICITNNEGRIAFDFANNSKELNINDTKREFLKLLEPTTEDQYPNNEKQNSTEKPESSTANVIVENQPKHDVPQSAIYQIRPTPSASNPTKPTASANEQKISLTLTKSKEKEIQNIQELLKETSESLYDASAKDVEIKTFIPSNTTDSTIAKLRLVVNFTGFELAKKLFKATATDWHDITSVDYAYPYSDGLFSDKFKDIYGRCEIYNLNNNYKGVGFIPRDKEQSLILCAPNMMYNFKSDYWSNCPKLMEDFTQLAGEQNCATH